MHKRIREMNQNSSVDFIVLGGGVSGLGFAKRVSDKGKSVLVLEKEAIVGGLSRSIFHNGYYVDFCAHRFHTKNKKLFTEITSLPGLTMERHIKRSRIYIFNKYLKYPFELQNLLRAMPLTKSIPAGVSFLSNLLAKKLRPKRPRVSYKEWFIDSYGPKLYEVMCKPYTSKIWHHDPSEISADWADQRFQGENLSKLMRRIFKKILTFDFSSYSLEDESLAPDGGEFYYPHKGIQELPDALARSAEKNGAIIQTKVTIRKINTHTKTVEYEREGIGYSVKYKQLISTIPLHTYYALQDKKDDKTEAALSQLEYMDIIFVYLFLDKEHISRDHWLYFPDKDIIFNRATEFSNWSPDMCPPGKTSVCFDITTFSNSPESYRSDEELIERTLADASRINYLKREWVKDSLVVRISHAYPYYDLLYKEKLGTVVSFLETPYEHLLGRTGIFRYNNSDNSIEMGFDLAEKLLAHPKTAPKQVSAYLYQVKDVSY